MLSIEGQLFVPCQLSSSLKTGACPGPSFECKDLEMGLEKDQDQH